MRILALDIGRKRTGIAATDATGTIASPVKVLPSNEVFDNAKTFRRVIEDYEPELLVVGLPVSLDGNENDHAKWVREVADKISAATSIPVEFQDERLTSSEAKRIMRDEGLSERDMRGKLDMVAASLILEAYIDGNR
ncbi:MAG: Holliday junction resolvase RuvX [Coriobacteriales bacterium]|jgi:putative Holliday junction resolvase